MSKNICPPKVYLGEFKERVEPFTAVPGPEKCTRCSSHVCLDSTYKLNWQGFPVIMIGTTDKAKHYHPFGLALSTDETSEDYAFACNSLKPAVSKVGLSDSK